MSFVVLEVSALAKQPTGPSGSWPGSAKGAGNSGVVVAFLGLSHLNSSMESLGEMGEKDCVGPVG